jgi:sugar lactone lactonase YvrE
MNKLIISLLIFSAGCQNKNIKFLGELSKSLDEVSGAETTVNSDYIWMLNDGGNSSKLYGVSAKGNIKEEIKIDAKNHDWEDLTSDEEGNLYIGDFGNNDSERKNLAILKVKKSALNDKGKVDIDRISFSYPNQEKFPPKNKNLYFDCEAFFYHNNNFYLFTKSRVKNDFGKTSLYKVPAKKGKHVAELLGTFNTCSDIDCWITSADISNDGKSIVLLSPKSVWVFTDFKGDDFFNGTTKEIQLDGRISQKESICFKDNNTLYITDEKAHGSDGNLYEFSLN